MKESEIAPAAQAAVSRGKGVWKILVAITACFLCLMIGLHLGGQTADDTIGYSIETEVVIPLEETAPPVTPVNINTASAEELDELPGIGPSLAEAIIQYRTEHGAFASVEELINVSGIGESKLAALEGQITVDD